MAYLRDEDLFKDIKQKNIANMYFLYGQEKYFISQAMIQIRKKVVDPSFESFNLNKLSGEKLDMSDFEDMMDGLPMMAEKRCIIIKDLELDKLVKQDYQKFIELVKNCSPTTVLIIYQDLVTVDMKKSSKYKKFAELISQNGVVCEFALKDKQTLKRKLCDRARRAYLELDMPTAEILIDRCSSSYMVLINELDKLISYVGEGEITKAHIDECSIKSIDSSAFDLAKSVLSNNFDRAYTLLDELFYQRQEGVAIVSALAMAFADIYRVKCGIVAGKSVDEIGVDFNYPKNRLFAIRNAVRDVRNFSIHHIRVCITALYDADIQLKSSKLDNRLILEQMLGKMLLMSINERAI